jgi:hypothetical protein
MFLLYCLVRFFSTALSRLRSSSYVLPFSCLLQLCAFAASWGSYTGSIVGDLSQEGQEKAGNRSTPWVYHLGNAPGPFLPLWAAPLRTKGSVRRYV